MLTALWTALVAALLGGALWLVLPSGEAGHVDQARPVFLRGEPGVAVYGAGALTEWNTA
jgi:hypothetical protein